MAQEIYDVLDTVTDGIRLQAELQPRVNYSLVASGIPFLRAVVVHNETDSELPGLELTATLTVGGATASSSRSLPGPILPNSATRIDDAHAFAEFAPLLAGAREAVPATLDIGVGAARIVAAVEVSAFNEFLNYPAIHEAIAAFVQPNTRAITGILRAASDLLMKRTGSGSLQGYQSGPERVQQIAGALYEAIRAAEITYINPPASFENTGQKVRTTEQVLAERFGTCIDLAVLYAACLEAAGLYPVIFLTAGHAFAGFHTAEAFTDDATVSTVNVLTTLVEAGRIVPVELTGVGPGKGSLDFRAAVKTGSAYFREQFDRLRTMVDITRARIDGVRPMSGFTGADGAQHGTELDDEQAAADRPFVARSSLRNLARPADDEIVRGVLEQQDDSPARFRNWKRDLLDLSLRNPLLNMPHTSKVLDLVVPGGMLAPLDDIVHAGKSVRLLGGVDSTELQKLAGARVASELSANVLGTLLTSARTVYSMRDGDKHRSQLRAMKREAETLEQETGSNYLYLTLGTLIHEKPSGGEARAPLFLLPVRLSGGLAFTPYSMKLDGDDIAQPNLCLLEWLRATKGLDLPELASPVLDDSGIAIGSVLAGIRSALLEAELPYRLDETASLAILRFSTFQIWKDLEENWRALGSRPVVRHLVERPGETFDDPAGSGEVPIDEENLRLPIAADGSQLEAIVRAASGRSFVLEGPPGTGKSQTITNLIAHAMARGKKVLFVAEKQAALEVVKRRLDAVGLGAFGLQLHGSSQSMRSIRDQLKASLDLRVTPDTSRWTATDARLRSAIGSLERYPDLVHATNAAGHSLWSAYDALGALGDGPTATVPQDWLSRGKTAEAEVLSREFSAAAAAVGWRPGHPWLLVGATAPGSIQLDSVRSGLAELRASSRQIAGLSAGLREAIHLTLPGAGLEVVLRLLSARSAGLLPTDGHLIYIDRPSWVEAVGMLRSRLSEYLREHAGILSLALPSAFTMAGIDESITRSAKLDESWFLPEFRRRRVLADLNAHLTAPVEGAAATATLGAIRAAAAAAEPIRAQAAAIQGLLLPEGWTAWTPDGAAALGAAHTVSVQSVWLAAQAPEAWRAVSVRAVSISDAAEIDASNTGAAVTGAAVASAAGFSASDELALRDVSATWTRWLAALGGSAHTVGQWSRGRDWVSAWLDAHDAWQRDLDDTGVLQPQRITESRRILTDLESAGLAAFADQLAVGTVSAMDGPEALLRGVAAASVTERSAAAALGDFDPDAQDRLVQSYLDSGSGIRTLLHESGPAQLLTQRPFDPENLRGEVAELGRQLERKRGGLSFREITRRYPDALLSIAPVFLMSPGSVAHYLDPTSLEFDLVVFDEASQIRVSQAIGAMGRAKAVVIVGDSKQMPPTRVMQVEVAADAVVEQEDLVVEDLESILTEAVESGLPQLWLGWHYRSQDESLIAFSNSRYYGSRLVSLPSPGDDPNAGVSWRRVDGAFDRGRTRTNEVEARAIVDEVMARLRDPASARETIGVVCFNIQQRDLILNLLEDSGDLLVQRALSAEPGSELFVKNLENVQGDERDTILFSLAFSVDKQDGVLPLNFGPLNVVGGERRLNVAVTRARKQIVLFSSFDPADIDLRRSSAQGIADLKRYLEFAATRAPLDALAQADGFTNRGRFVDELSAALVAAGWETRPELGMSAFKIDLAVRAPGDERWRLAIMVDGPGWNSRPTVADREGSASLLTDLMHWGAVARVWLPGWLRDRDGTIGRLIALLERPIERHVVDPGPDAPDAAVSVELGSDQRGPNSIAEVADSLAAQNGGTAAAQAVTPFVRANDSVIASQSVLENMRMAMPAIQRIAAEILETEGPIPIDRLVGTVTRRFGYSRVGEAKRTDVAAVVADTFAVVDGFVWPPHLDPASWRGIRRSASSEDRAITEVGPGEIVNAMEFVLRQSFSMTRDDLLREAAGVLGYSRLTEAARSWLDSALELGLSTGRLAADGDRLRAG